MQSILNLAGIVFKRKDESNLFVQLSCVTFSELETTLILGL